MREYLPDLLLVHWTMESNPAEFVRFASFAIAQSRIQFVAHQLTQIERLQAYANLHPIQVLDLNLQALIIRLSKGNLP